MRPVALAATVVALLLVGMCEAHAATEAGPVARVSRDASPPIARESSVAAQPAARVAPDPPQPVVRVTLDAPQPVLVGQQVHMDVVVLVPNFFTSAPQFPPIDAPGATVTLLDDAVNANDTIGGVGYAGVQRTYVVTARQPGEVKLSSAQITFVYAAEPGKPGVSGSAEIPARTLTAKSAGSSSTASDADAGSSSTASDAGADATAPVAQLSVEQSLDRGLDGIAVGDTLTRTISTFARNATATSIPEPTFTAPDGVRVYPRDPVLTDVGVRDGGPGGRRVDRVTYTFEKAGSYTLPAIEIAWLDPADQQRKTSTAPEIRLTVATGTGAAPAIAPRAAAPGEEEDPAARRRSRAVLGRALAWLVAASILAATLTLGWRRLMPKLRAERTRRRAAYAGSEDAAFDRLERACRAADPAAAYHALLDWRRRAGATVWPSQSDADAADLDAQVAALEGRLYDRRDGAARGAWRGEPLLEAVTRARTASSPQRDTQAPGVALPALNP